MEKQDLDLVLAPPPAEEGPAFPPPVPGPEPGRLGDVEVCATTDLVWMVDDQTHELMWFNRAMETYFRLERDVDVAVGMGPEAMFSEPDYVRVFHDLYRRAAEGNAFATEFKTRGGTRLLRVSLNPISIDGVVAGISVYCQDITARRRTRQATAAMYAISEAAQSVGSLHELLPRIHEIVARLIPAGNFYVAVLDEETGKITFPYFVDEVDPPPAPRQRGNSLTDFVLRTGRAHLLSPMEMRALVAEGEIQVQGTYPLDWLGVPLTGPEGTFGMVGVQSYSGDVRYGGDDIDLLQFVSTQIATSIQRKRAEVERVKLQAQLLQAQKMESMGRLAGGVAHDMNNVLGAILALASVHLEIQPRDSQAYRAFETISEAATRGGKLVRSLLDFARQAPAEERELDLNSLLQEEVRLLERSVLANVNLVLDLAPDLRSIQGDPGALTHALMNLCVNSVDAMEGAGTLTLGTRNLGEDTVEVRVEDTGCGMPREVLDRALDPFFTTKPVGKGTGLGLSMVYSSVKAHHGHMEIRSEPGQGTAVRIRFPARRPVLGAGQGPQGRPGTPSREPLKVLVVDDDGLVLRSTRMMVEGMGLQPTLASSGEEALTLLEDGLRPDLVILDLNMPGLGGAGTLPRLRGLCPHVPILLATGLANEVARTLVAAYPDVTLLAKPYSVEDLQARLLP